MEKLKRLEERFYQMYPGGFSDVAFDVIHKKHNIHKLSEFFDDMFQEASFKDENHILEASDKLISRSTLVSRFEKPIFRAFIQNHAGEAFVQALKALYWGDEAQGFDMLISLLAVHKLHKWPVISAFLAYKNPMEEVFIKPTTTKKILKHFEVDGMTYSAMPSYDFYQSYKAFINDLKANTGQGLQVNNMAFCGFLLMTIEA